MVAHVGAVPAVQPPKVTTFEPAIVAAAPHSAEIVVLDVCHPSVLRLPSVVLSLIKMMLWLLIFPEEGIKTWRPISDGVNIKSILFIRNLQS